MQGLNENSIAIRVRMHLCFILMGVFVKGTNLRKAAVKNTQREAMQYVFVVTKASFIASSTANFKTIVRCEQQSQLQAGHFNSKKAVVWISYYQWHFHMLQYQACHFKALLNSRMAFH